MTASHFGCDLDFDEGASLDLHNRQATAALLRALRRYHPELDPRRLARIKGRSVAEKIARRGATPTPTSQNAVVSSAIEPHSPAQPDSTGVQLRQGAQGSTHQRGVVSVETIKRLVCEQFRITHQDLLSMRRQEHLVRPRQLAIWLCRELTPLSFPQIAHRFGDRDHTTILHACRRVDALIARDATFAAEARSLRMLMESMG